MIVNCHTIIQDPVLNFKIRKYINQTPFLTTGRDENEHIAIQIPSDTDLIVLEATLLTMDNLTKLQLKFSDKSFLILTDLLMFLARPNTDQTVVLSKNICYSDFIDGLCALSENTKEKNS